MDRVVELLKKLADIHEENNERIRKETRVFEILLDDKMTDGEKLLSIGVILST